MHLFQVIARTLCIVAMTSIGASAYADDTVQTPPPGGEEFEQAALDYVSWCAPCHGRTGKGNGPVAPSLVTSPTDLTELSANAGGVFPADKVRQRIDGRDVPTAHGTVEMPVWGYWFNLHEMAGGLLQEDREVAEKRVANRIARLVEYLELLQK